MNFEVLVSGYIFIFFILYSALFKSKELQACNFFKKETLRQLFSSEFCEISKSTFFTEHIWATASKKELILHIIICHYLYFFKNFLHLLHQKLFTKTFCTTFPKMCSLHYQLTKFDKCHTFFLSQNIKQNVICYLKQFSSYLDSWWRHKP